MTRSLHCHKWCSEHSLLSFSHGSIQSIEETGLCKNMPSISRLLHPVDFSEVLIYISVLQ